MYKLQKSIITPKHLIHNCTSGSRTVPNPKQMDHNMEQITMIDIVMPKAIVQ